MDCENRFMNHRTKLGGCEKRYSARRKASVPRKLGFRNDRLGEVLRPPSDGEWARILYELFVSFSSFLVQGFLQHSCFEGMMLKPRSLPFDKKSGYAGRRVTARNEGSKLSSGHLKVFILEPRLDDCLITGVVFVVTLELLTKHDARTMKS